MSKICNFIKKVKEKVFNFENAAKKFATAAVKFTEGVKKFMGSPAEKIVVAIAKWIANDVGDDSASASSNNVGAIRYRVSGNNSYCEMVMQTGASTYALVIIKQNTW